MSVKRETIEIQNLEDFRLVVVYSHAGSPFM
jgi:hypothetical protein